MINKYGRGGVVQISTVFGPPSAANMLISIVKNLHITKRDFFQLNCLHSINKYGKDGVVQISAVLGPT